MADEWYYANDMVRHGPFSAIQMKNLAHLGTIVPTDTVWKGGVEQGVLASRIKNLFASGRVPGPLPVKPDVLPMPPTPERQESIATAETATPVPLERNASESAPTAAAELLQEPPTVISGLSRTRKPAPKKGKAVVIKGAEIVSQDGIQAKYRKICTVCGHKDSACQTITLINKTLRANFFCGKCKKRRDVSVQCTSG